MRHFAIAFGIVCGAAVILFSAAVALLSSLGLPQPQPQAAAATLATAVVSSFTKVAEFLEQQESKKRLAVGRRKPVYDFRGFQIGWALMAVYGTLWLVVLLQAAGFVAGFIFSGVMTSTDSENASNLVALSSFLQTIVMIFAAYFIGRWIGTRISRLGIVTMFLIAVFAPLIAVGLDVAVLSDETYRKFAGSERWAFFETFKQIARISFIIVVPGLIGYWGGQRQRLSKYLDYLLHVLPAQDRDTVVELAYGEAQRVAAAVGEVRKSHED
jgi:hypothetical protein